MRYPRNNDTLRLAIQSLQSVMRAERAGTVTLTTGSTVTVIESPVTRGITNTWRVTGWVAHSIQASSTKAWLKTTTNKIVVTHANSTQGARTFYWEAKDNTTT